MVHDFSSSSVLLTYKGKLLLLGRDLSPISAETNIWRFIGGEKIDNESFEETIYREIEYTTKLSLKSVQRLSSSRIKKDKQFYHGKLTDDNVNSIERREGQLLDFFTLPELEKLSLTETTRLFLAEYKNAVEELFL